MRKLSLCLLVTMWAIGGLPATAHAGIAWWDYIEQLSGPGPLTGGAARHLYD